MHANKTAEEALENKVVVGRAISLKSIKFGNYVRVKHLINKN